MNSLCRNGLAYLLLIASGCSSQNSNNSAILSYQIINGRDEGNPQQRLPVYRVKAPKDWVRKNPEPYESILDSTKAICEFWIVDGEDNLRVSIHNFPVETMEQRIPSMAQVNRWKRQFTSLTPIDTKITPQAFSGYAGLLFEGTGMLKGKQTTMLAWSMQLAPEHFRNLNLKNKALEKQMKADFTIKASGPSAMMFKYKSILIHFANTFELIEEVPARL